MSLQEIHLLKKFLEDDADSFHDGDAISVDDLIESIEVHNQSAQKMGIGGKRGGEEVTEAMRKE